MTSGVLRGDGGATFSPAAFTAPLHSEPLQDVRECYHLLAGERVGRVAFSEAALPSITPVQFRTDEDGIYFRLPPELRLWKAIEGAVVAFSADNLDPRGGAGWTVVITGVATRLPGSGGAHPVAADPTGLLEDPVPIFRISDGLVTGRRLLPLARTTPG